MLKRIKNSFKTLKEPVKLYALAAMVVVVISVLAVVSNVGAVGVTPDNPSNSGGPPGGLNVSVINVPNVSVVNTPTVNLAQGTSLSIIGTSNVNITNTPAVNLAPGTSVGINGTSNVTIVNIPDNPVLVRDVDNPARQPFQKSIFIQLYPSEGIGIRDFSVPSHKRLVIEFISVNANVLSGQKVILNIRTTVNDTFTKHWLSTSLQGTFDVRDIFVTSQQMRVYADPETKVYLEANRNAISGSAEIEYTVSGYLIDVP